jgi:RNase P protein component
MYVVLLDPEVLPAHNVFADSVNNGPWGARSQPNSSRARSKISEDDRGVERIGSRTSKKTFGLAVARCNVKRVLSWAMKRVIIAP